MSDSRPVPAPLTVIDYERLCELSGELFVVVRDGGAIEHANPAWEQTLGWPLHELLGRPWFELIHPDDLAETRAEIRRAREHGFRGLENRYRTWTGGWRRLSWRGALHGDRWYCVAEDITQRHRLEQDVLRDPLTGVLNRAAFLDRLAHALARAEREHHTVAVLFLDLDGFKTVNDTLGHAVGDTVLAQVAGRLATTVRRADSLARFGGDEFVVLAENLGGEDAIALLVERIRSATAMPVPVGAGTVALGASIGVVVARGGSASEVVHEADVAMYRAKATGRNRAVWFDDALRLEVRGRLALAADLHGALDGGELRMHFQPLVSVQDESVVGCEALLRWEHPVHGTLAPDAFLPIAEQDGDIIRIGAWVLEESCRQQRRWRAAGQDLAVSVNVSARELADPAYADRVGTILRGTGVDPVSVVLEVTETALMTDIAVTAKALTALKRLGVRIALDDFGRGYSSFEHVKTLPVDVIKIDRSFVASIDRHEEDRAIVAAVVALANTTGLTVIAEGVEADSQLRVLRELGCALAQGYYFGRPAPAEQLVLDGFLPRGRPGIGDPFVIREFMRQIGVPARIR